MEEAAAVGPYDLFPLLRDVKDVVIDLALAAGRLLGLVAVMPVFKRTELGRVFLAMIAFGLALPIAGGLATEIERLPVDELWYLSGLMLKEFAVGAVLGVLFGVPFWAIQAVGEVVDHQRTIGESGMFDPGTGSQGSVMSALLGLVAVTLFVAQGGLGLMTATIYESYEIWELGRFLPELGGGALGEVAAILGRIALFGLMVAAPPVVLFLLCDVATMALARTSGRIDITLTLPLVKNVAFALFAVIYLEFLMGYLGDGLRETGAVTQLLRTFAGQ